MSDWLTFHDEPVTLHSGNETHWLIDAKKMFDDLLLREQILNSWKSHILGDHGKKPLHVIGIPEGGMPWAKAFADKLGVSCSRLDQPLPRDCWYILVDDVATTGKSIMTQGPWFYRFLVVARNPALRNWLEPPFARVWMWIDLGVFPIYQEVFDGHRTV